MKQVNSETASESGQMDVQQQQQASSYQSSYGRLIEACKKKDLQAMSSILINKPDLAIKRDKHNRTLLHYTAIILDDENEGEQGHSTDQCIDCFNYLTDNCDLKLWWQQDQDGLSVLHLAVISSNVPLVKHIVFEHPYSIKYSLVCTLDNESHSPLHWAVITNNLECVQIIISFAGSKLAHEPDLNGATPLHYATQTRDYPKYRKQLRSMLNGVACESQVSDDLRGAHNENALDERLSVQNSDDTLSHQRGLEILEYLADLDQINLECVDKDHRTPLLWAASSGNRDAILLLVNHGANVLSCDINKLGALHCAASHGFTDCLECLLSLNASSSVKVNQADNLNCTPLFYGVLSGNIDCIETLLDRGAKQDWQDSKGRTAAHFAALKGQLNSLKLLQDRGANLWLANKQGDLPLHYAIKSGRQQVAQWLLSNSPYEHSVNAINNFGRAPIHLAILKNNLEMCRYLIKCGSNLNQLVKMRDKNLKRSTERGEEVEPAGSNANQRLGKRATTHHYETALDMAKRLGYQDCYNLLKDNQARPAAEVMLNRVNRFSSSQWNSSPSNAVAKPSLFELSSVDLPSPIGFETSSSSASPLVINQEAKRKNHSLDEQNAHIPQLSRPRPDSLPQTDSTGSSALSQNSLTSLRGFAQVKPPKEQQKEDPLTNTGPYRGGISYNNEHVNASIKYKLYGNQRSFPMNSNRQLVNSAPVDCNGAARSQEIITNVNVYTSPCPHCNQYKLNQCVGCDSSGQLAKSTRNYSDKQELVDENYSDETSDTTTGSSEETPQQSHCLPAINCQKQHEMVTFPRNQFRHLPPSQNHERHLPVILSDQEQSNSAASNERSADSSPNGVGALERSPENPMRSPATEEPRFDRSHDSRSIQRVDRYPLQVRSPVAEYINSGPHHDQRSRSLNRAQEICAGKQSYRSKGKYSQIKAKVDSHRVPDDPLRAKSMSMLSHRSIEGANGETTSRSVSRQTITKMYYNNYTPDFNAELATNVEKSIRKYRQENKLFEELQGLKRSQIRSGRANEALLVKRLVDHFRLETFDLIGLELYHGPYTYQSYERFLYDQLRKLSQSNSAKLSPLNDYLDEDLKADMELRRVIGEETNSYSENGDRSDVVGSKSTNQQSVQREWIYSSNSENLDPSLDNKPNEKDADEGHDTEAAAKTVDNIEPEVEKATRRASSSSLCSSRRSSIDIERERLINLPLVTNEVVLEQEANSLSSAIIVDALGNISRATSASTVKPATSSDDQTNGEQTVSASGSYETNELDLRTTTGSAASSKGRRRSVVSINNKMEVVYHDVAIEIDHAEDSDVESTHRDSIQHEQVAQDGSTESKLDNVDEEVDGEDDGETSEVSTDTRKSISLQNMEDSGKESDEKLDEEIRSRKSSADLNRFLQMSSNRLSRRGSSPPAYKELEQEYGSTSTNKASQSRRASSSDVIGSVKKIFNGHDLDELRQKRSPRRTVNDSSETERESAKADSDYTSESVADTSKFEHDGSATNEVSPRQSSKRIVMSPTRRRLAPSKLPKNKYKPNVQVEEIKRRWSQIKAQGRSQMIKGNQESEDASIFRFTSAGNKSSIVKSQPNLEHQLDESSELDFILMYEVNTQAKSQLGDEKKIAVWCPKKAIRIVDVRTLKRTLSLPESLIYSNNLLKRFGILKL